MENSIAKDSLVARYVEILKRGIPQGSLPPFKRWVTVLADSTGADQGVLMNDIRAAAMQRVKAETRPHC